MNYQKIHKLLNSENKEDVLLAVEMLRFTPLIELIKNLDIVFKEKLTSCFLKCYKKTSSCKIYEYFETVDGYIYIGKYCIYLDKSVKLYDNEKINKIENSG